MPSAPQLLPTQISEGAAPGLGYRLEGELVPVLHMALDGSVPVYFEHHVLLWKYPQMQIGLHPLKKGLKRRVFGGLPLLLLEAQSAGEIAFSRDAPGHIVALHLPQGHGIVVREHQFLAATGNVQYDFSRVKGFANVLYGGGFFIDEFFAGDHEGVVWVHGYGNVFEKYLDAGETIDIEPGGWVYRDHEVQMSQQAYGFKTGLLGGGAGNLIFNRFTGPGRVGLQSAYYHPPVAETGGGGGRQDQGGGLGGLIGGSRQLMPPPPGHLAANPLPPGIVGALGLGGYQLLGEVAGIGVGRLGEQTFLLAAADPDPSRPDPGTQISLHHQRLRDEAELPAWLQLAAQLGYLRLSGYRLALERDGVRSNISLVDPASGRVAARIPARHPGRLARGGQASPPRLLSALRGLPPAGPPPDAQDPELLRQVILALALADDEIGAAEAVDLADRAVGLVRAAPELDPPAALSAARRQSG